MPDQGCALWRYAHNTLPLSECMHLPAGQWMVRLAKPCKSARHQKLRCVDYISRNSNVDIPFFLYVGFTQFHHRGLCPPDFEGVPGGGYYSDIKYEVDHNIGRILRSLDESGIAGNTIVVLTGDNGPGTLPQGSGYATGEVGGSTGPWRGSLSTGFEGGLRTPAMVRWPGSIPAGVVTNEIVLVLDIYPTLATLVGENARIPIDRPIDGVDQSSFLLGKQTKLNREHVVTFVGDNIFAVKWRDLKVHFFTAEVTFSENKKYFSAGLQHKRRPRRAVRVLGT